MERRTRDFLVFALAAGFAGSAVATRASGCNLLTGQCPGGIVCRTATVETARTTRPADDRPAQPTPGTRESE